MTADLDWDDLFDAEILVERTGRAWFDRESLADLLGISTHAVHDCIRRGTVPPPSYFERLSFEEGTVRAIWTCALAAEALADRRRRTAVPPCGTNSAYRRHKKRGEPVDDACREAHRVKCAEERAARKLVSA